jgi:hypothetical protein
MTDSIIAAAEAALEAARAALAEHLQKKPRLDAQAAEDAANFARGLGDQFLRVAERREREFQTRAITLRSTVAILERRLADARADAPRRKADLARAAKLEADAERSERELAREQTRLDAMRHEIETARAEASRLREAAAAVQAPPAERAA